MKTFCIGDIHGRIEALREVLKKSKFDYNNDKLIILGDVCDGGYNTYECVEELLKIKNRVFVLGNHDEWFIQHMADGFNGDIWLQQGGKETLESYGAKVDRLKIDSYYAQYNILWKDGMRIPETHKRFFESFKLFHIENNMLFVHGGINPHKTIGEQDKQTLLWDRELIEWYKDGNRLTTFSRIFIGHTTTQHIMNDVNYTKPVIISNLYCLDCGAGWDGKLCIFCIDDNKYLLSRKSKSPRS